MFISNSLHALAGSFVNGRFDSNYADNGFDDSGSFLGGMDFVSLFIFGFKTAKVESRS
jgi:hypothetical protein